MSGSAAPSEDRRAVRSWYLYDWANSAFVTCMTTAVFPIYYLTLFPDSDDVTLKILGGTWHTSGMALWAYTSALSMFLVVLVAPVLGAIADLARGKKRFLGFCTFVGALLTATISLAAEGDYLLCSALYIGANFLWSAGNIFYDGFLPELTDEPKRMDAISAAGFAIGYLGGGIALALSVGIIMGHEAIASIIGSIIGNDAFVLTKGDATRVTFLLVAAWWALFTLPLLRHVRERPGESTGVRGIGYVRAGFGRLAHTLRKVRQLPNLGRMLLAFLLYNSGLGTIIIIAAAFGKADLGLSRNTLIGAILVVQFLGLPATFAYIKLARRLGTRKSILAGLVIYMGVVIYATQIDSATEFWILGILVALVQGGVQAMSRSLYGSMIPEGMSAEFFGFFSVFNKVGPFFGPLLFAAIRDATGSSRSAILFLILFFIAGFLVLMTVRGERGREEAKAFVEE